MYWNKEAVGKVIQDTRLALGLTLEEAGGKAGLKPSVLSSLEKGRHSRPPNLGTQAKIEEAFGIVLPIPRGVAIKTTLYIPPDSEQYMIQAVTHFQSKSMSAALMCALKEWSEHVTALEEWKRTHGGKI